ncbi:unnamed protein product [Pseudo-nitzschia multistriata]|uniref:Uncharacterized protein n=1 Tax=Pseudo-nitzschia multistriata TaxID=183589 RepID=A0A448ZE84_9STRA|nr:unnamed protein product [Pseudo-nitzschia multistriata]
MAEGCCGNPGLRPCKQTPGPGRRAAEHRSEGASCAGVCLSPGDNGTQAAATGTETTAAATATPTSTPPHDPWTYHTRANHHQQQQQQQTRHLEFPLGGFGTGNVLLTGDGRLDGWDVLNQFRNPEYTPLHSLPVLPGDDGTGSNCWAISAVPDGDENPGASRRSLLLRSADRGGGSPPRTHGSPDASPVPACVPGLAFRARYPIAEVSYETPPSFPLGDVSLEAMTPLVPTATKESSYPMAVFAISFSNTHPTRTVSVDVMQSTLNFVGWDGGRERERESKRHGSSGCTGTKGSWPDRTARLPACLWGGNTNQPFAHTGPPSPSAGSKNEDGSRPSHGETSDRRRRSCTGLFLYSQNGDLEGDLSRKGSVALSAIHPPGPEPAACSPAIGLIGGVGSSAELFRRFRDRDFEAPPGAGQAAGPPPSRDGTTYIGAVVQSFTGIPPGATVEAVFCLSWHFPYRPCTAPRDNLPGDWFGNRYTQWFGNAMEVACRFCDTFSTGIVAEAGACLGAGAGGRDRKHDNHCGAGAGADGNKSENKNENEEAPAVNATNGDGAMAQSEKGTGHALDTKPPKNLLELTRLYVETLYSSTIPWEILESAAGRVAVARSPTMFWTESGIVLGNEGNECCPLNCTHVYGYTTLLERLFPDLARDMRTSDFVRNFDLSTKGGCTTRFGGDDPFAIDGGLACVIKTYLVVLQSDPGLEFLKSVWPGVKGQMEEVFAKHLDAKAGVILVPQQNTYDTAMEGANTFIGSYLVTALRATSAMATWMGDVNFSKKCEKQAEVSRAKYEELCWREDLGYYVADVDETNCQNSYGPGCFIDQLAAIGLSAACGLGHVFDPDREARARRAIVRNNKVSCPPFRDQQCHLFQGDSGLRVCTYPNGKLGSGMVYSDLVSSGFAYPVAAGCLLDGNWEDATRICRMIRDRQSGVHRSPWNEPECGQYYARSMAGWNLLDQACGFSYDSTKAAIGFRPGIHATSFSCFCTFAGGFGEFRQTGTTTTANGTVLAEGTVRLGVLYGSTKLKTIRLNTTARVVKASLDGKSLDASIDATGAVALASEITIGEDSVLTLILSAPSGHETKERTFYPNGAATQEPPPTRKQPSSVSPCTVFAPIQTKVAAAIILIGAIVAIRFALCSCGGALGFLRASES